jgi:hypothetical protein
VLGTTTKEAAMSAPTAVLTNAGSEPASRPWVLALKGDFDPRWPNSWWSFARRVDAIAFAARRGIRLEET